MVSPRRCKTHVTGFLVLLSQVFVLGCGLSRPEQPPTEPAAILRAIGTTNGLCVLLGPPRPEVALRLARASGLMVYVQSSDLGQVSIMRQAADRAGLLGKRVFVDQGVPGKILLADNLADAVLVYDQAEVPGQPAVLELARVIRPGGVVLGSILHVEKEAGGTDAWSHPYHGPDNNPLSTDRVARAPYRTQFLAEPLFSSQPEVTVAAGGRVFKAFGHMTFRAYQNPAINTLYALSAYNGAILWKRPLKEGFMIHRNTMIATPETLYLADDVSCKLIDAATGQVKSEIVAPAGPEAGAVWKWMAIDGGILYALLGPTEVQAPVAKGTETRIGGWPWGMWPGYDYKDPTTAWGFGRTFVALDLATRKVRWTHQEPVPLDARGVCMGEGRIFFFCPDRFLGCIDQSTGNPGWKSSDPALLDAIGPNEKAQHYITGFATTAYIKEHRGVIMFAGPQRRSLVGVSAVDGRLLWQKKGGNFQLVLRDDAIFALGEQNGKSYKLDYPTGNVITEFAGRRACTRATGTVDSVFCRATEGTMRWEVATNRLEHISPMRPACHDGVIVSDGHLYWGPWICGCHLTLVGAICLAPAGVTGPPDRDDDPSRILSGERWAGLSLMYDPKDWPSYQADNRRSRTTRAAVPDAVEVAWTHLPGSPVVPTAPVAAGRMVFVGGTDGVVRALDAESGGSRWLSYTGGSIFFPPTIVNDTAYVGSNDGRVYAFDAASGSGIWRYRVAPAERKIPVYGELVSTWPVAGGVVVEKDTLYAAAGISHFDGAHVYALDAGTGKPRWHNADSGIVDPEVHNGISLCGNLRLEGDTLSFPGGNVYVTATYDARTGKNSNTPAGPHTSRRVFLWPRKLWEPIDSDDLAAPQGQVSLRLKRGGRQVTLALQPAGTTRPAWSHDLTSYGGAAATANALLVLAQTAETENGQPAPQQVVAYRWQDGSVLWSQPLPSAAVHHGLAVDARGRIIVSLEDGRILCLAARESHETK